MIKEVFEGQWIHPHDLGREILGRHDTAEDREACISVIQGLGRDKKRVPTGARVAVTSSSELAAGRVLAATRPQTLDAQVEAYQRTIDRLLAFVPARAAAVSEERLYVLVSELVEAAQNSFPSVATISAIATPEDNTETEACHRIALRVALDQNASAEDVANATFAVHRRFAEIATVEERLAVTLLVDVVDATEVEDARPSTV